MRIDKFLKVSRMIKRREVAKQLCLDNDILINGKVAKPMSIVEVGDTLVLTLGKHVIECKIREIREFANKEQASKMINIINDTIKE